MTSVEVMGQFKVVIRWEGLVNGRGEAVMERGFPAARPAFADLDEVVLAEGSDAAEEGVCFSERGCEFDGWAQSINGSFFEKFVSAFIRCKAGMPWSPMGHYHSEVMGNCGGASEGGVRGRFQRRACSFLSFSAVSWIQSRR